MPPCAPTRFMRDTLAIAAEALGANLRNIALPALDARRKRSVLAPLTRTDRDAFPMDRPCPVTRAVSPPPDATPFETVASLKHAINGIRLLPGVYRGKDR
jgi:hypothetical protein